MKRGIPLEYTITLPENFKTCDIKTLLEKEWLVPRKVRHFLRMRKNIQVNGETKMFHELVYPLDQLTLTFEDSDYQLPTIQLGKAKLITPLYEDEHFIIVNKPYGMKTHPNQPDETNTLLNHLAAYLAPKKQNPYVVHRLDKETSGAILFAKNPFILPILGRLLEQKEIKRTYQAIVKGSFSSSQLTIEKKIGRHRQDRRKRVVDERHGQVAITHVTVMEQLAHTSHVECQLDTGRTHQIRVHLASLGHPVLGDPLYHPQPSQGADRLMLHAKSLELIHPFTQQRIYVEAQPLLW